MNITTTEKTEMRTKRAPSQAYPEAVDYRLSVYDAHFAATLSIRETAELFMIPIGTVSSWLSLGEIERFYSDESKIYIHKRFEARLRKYRRPLRSDVDVRLGSRPRKGSEDAPVAPELSSLSVGPLFEDVAGGRSLASSESTISGGGVGEAIEILLAEIKSRKQKTKTLEDTILHLRSFGSLTE